MRRLEYLLLPPNQRHPSDVRRLQEALPGLRAISPLQVERLYREFSEVFYCAGWHSISQPIAEEFWEWLQEDIP